METNLQIQVPPADEFSIPESDLISPSGEPGDVQDIQQLKSLLEPITEQNEEPPSENILLTNSQLNLLQVEKLQAEPRVSMPRLHISQQHNESPTIQHMPIKSNKVNLHQKITSEMDGEIDQSYDDGIIVQPKKNFLNISSDQSMYAVPYSKQPVKVYFLVTIKVPDYSKHSHIKPVSIVLAIDKSENMIQENKLQYTIEAGQILIDHLSKQDRIGILEYDSDVKIRQEIIPAYDKFYIRSKMNLIQVGSQSNMSDALIRSQQMFTSAEPLGIKRVILISGQRPNKAITDPDNIGQISGQYRTNGDRDILLLTIGTRTSYYYLYDKD
ncbi:MAG: hypothetical protein EZS28_023697 [Streblomastix strix]|uniref:VWFA domain-containing protein n=1 Tax=Streblomastix strix TaxID=222440 RepID=A0A5J4VEF8_9EUKA|nr:MAG: hypothetical protein EZS28_023697 [Streblomastix strix]